MWKEKKPTCWWRVPAFGEVVHWNKIESHGCMFCGSWGRPGKTAPLCPACLQPLLWMKIIPKHHPWWFCPVPPAVQSHRSSWWGKLQGEVWVLGTRSNQRWRTSSQHLENGNLRGLGPGAQIFASNPQHWRWVKTHLSKEGFLPRHLKVHKASWQRQGRRCFGRSRGAHGFTEHAGGVCQQPRPLDPLLRSCFSPLCSWCHQSRGRCSSTSWACSSLSHRSRHRSHHTFWSRWCCRKRGNLKWMHWRTGGRRRERKKWWRKAQNTGIEHHWLCAMEGSEKHGVFR